MTLPTARNSVMKENSEAPVSKAMHTFDTFWYPFWFETQKQMQYL